MTSQSMTTGAGADTALHGRRSGRRSVLSRGWGGARDARDARATRSVHAHCCASSRGARGARPLRSRFCGACPHAVRARESLNWEGVGSGHRRSELVLNSAAEGKDGCGRPRGWTAMASATKMARGEAEESARHSRLTSDSATGWGSTWMLRAASGWANRQGSRGGCLLGPPFVLECGAGPRVGRVLGC